jgi:hypothetical protein
VTTIASDQARDNAARAALLCLAALATRAARIPEGAYPICKSSPGWRQAEPRRGSSSGRPEGTAPQGAAKSNGGSFKIQRRFLDEGECKHMACGDGAEPEHATPSSRVHAHVLGVPGDRLAGKIGRAEQHVEIEVRPAGVGGGQNSMTFSPRNRSAATRRNFFWLPNI